MKEIKDQCWKNVKFGNKNEFRYWSPKVMGKGDKDLSPDSPLGDWRKIIILKPTGDPEAVLLVGFSSVFGDTQISSVPRQVKEGPFGMRMGPEDCNFFIVSNDGKVELKIVQYIDIAELELDLY